MSTKILSQKTVFQSKYFQVNRVEIERNGKTFTKDIIERNSSVFVLPLTEENELYLVSQYRDAHGKVLLEIVAGTMDAGETSPLDVAKRELEEEAGLTAKSWKKLATLETSANMKSTVHLFLAKDLTLTKQQMDEDEDITIVKLPMSEVLEKIETGEISISSNVASLLLFDKLQKKNVKIFC